MENSYSKSVDTAYNLHVSGQFKEALFLYEKLLEVNRYLNMVGLLDDYNDYHQEQERQRNADITEQISYDVSDRAENFAEWEPER